jgi:hypothetical protein
LVGQPVGDHTDSGQAESFQLADSTGQGNHDRHFIIHWLYDPSRVILRKTTNERGKARFMVFIVEPLIMPTLERRFQGEVEEVTVGTSLDANANYHLPFGSIGLVFEK